VRHKLDQAGLVRSDRLARGRDDLEVRRERGLRREGADLPSGRLADTDLGLADALRLLVGGDDVADDSGDFELFRRLSLAMLTSRNAALTKTSNVPLKPILRLSWLSLLSERRKLCLKIAVMNESEMIMNPFVAFARDFISSRPTWSRHPA
jgi:hypothetical protein